MKTTITDLGRMKEQGRRITMITAYDFTTANLLDRAGIPVLLVGDSLSMTMLGHENTLAVTLDEMLHHSRAVARGAKDALLVGDMPFMSYHLDQRQAVESAGRFLKEGGMHAVKMEGGGRVIDHTRALTGMGVPVMGHLGLTPQFVNQFGGFKVQGRSDAAQEQLLADALALEAAGAFCLVLEGIPAGLGRQVTDLLRIPTIGIGAGPGTSGQVLVVQDLLGLTQGPLPKFVKQYDQLGDRVIAAARAFMEETESGAFPTEAHVYA
ncbi:MAG: 3-methyl-2-oxobutanoate hydroxymethyltransferase [Candidatus Dormibacteria bacterium]